MSLNIPDLPESVLEYMQVTKEMDDVRKHMRALRERLREVSPKVHQWVCSLPNREISIQPESTEHRSVFGEGAKLSVKARRRREGLNQKTLPTLLFRFFKQLFPDRSDADLNQLAHVGAVFIVESRQTTEEYENLVRSKARQKSRQMES